jgi:hypothetical protein
MGPAFFKEIFCGFFQALGGARVAAKNNLEICCGGPKGRDRTSRGNALGKEEKSKSKALKGRDILECASGYFARSGLADRLAIDHPGRCPGLSYRGPLGLNCIHAFIQKTSWRAAMPHSRPVFAILKK